MKVAKKKAGRMRERKQGIYADFQHSIKVVFERIGPHQPPQDISLLGISI